MVLLGEFDERATMKEHREEINKEFVYKLISLQITITLIISLFALLISKDAAFSAAIGGSIGVIGNAYFARGVFKPEASRPAKEILITFYASEVSKLVIVFVLFFIAFKSVEALQDSENALVMFLSFAATLCVNIVAPLLIEAKEKTS